MKILSNFDGISCGLLALKRAGIPVEKYYSSEICKNAIKVSEANFPGEIERLGDINQVDFSKLGKIDLILAGSPCTGFSFAGKQLNFTDPQSKLIFKFFEAIEALKPKYFLLENVPMKKEYRDVISRHLGVEPVLINSALVSAQNRKRWYWANFPITQPEDKGIFLKDILETSGEGLNYSSSGRGNGKIEARISEALKAATLTKTGYTNRSMTGVIQINPDKSAGGKQPHMQHRVYDPSGKSPAITKSFGARINIYERPHGFNLGGFKSVEKMPTVRKATKDNYFLINGIEVRKLTQVELERLQTLPDGFTKSLTYNQASAVIGNGWTVDVIAHILKGLPQND